MAVAATPEGDVVNRRLAIAPITRRTPAGSAADQDLVAVEAAARLWVVIPGRADRLPLGLLMRTPGDDEDLVTGVLCSEGVIVRAEDILLISTREIDDEIEAHLAPGVDVAALVAARAEMTTSACGLCGRLERLRPPVVSGAVAETWPAALLSGLSDRLLAGQAVFAETGGLHAAGLFDATGQLVFAREDVGRHNAVDKVVGAALRAGRAIDSTDVLVVSGRAAYEIVHKAAMCGVGALVAVGAPSSLAVEAARAAGLTLIGFARQDRFNVYAGHGRVG